MVNKKRVKFSWGNIMSIPENYYGIYVFWFRKKNKFIYVGQAKKQPIRERLKQHWRHETGNYTLSLWIKGFGDSLEICYLPAKGDKIDRWERRLIRHFNPETNTKHRRT